MKDSIMAHLKKYPQQRFNARQLAHYLDVDSAEHKSVRHVLKELVNLGKVAAHPDGRFSYRDVSKVLKGRIKINQANFGFVLPESRQRADIFIPARFFQDAWSGDTVLVESARNERDGRFEGRVIQIIERALKMVMGQLQKKGDNYVVVTEDPGITQEIYIPKKSLGKAVKGDLVVVKIMQYPGPGVMAIGEVCKIIDSDAGDESLTDVALFKREIFREFNSKVHHELQKLPNEVKVLKDTKRLDLSDLPIMTIDGITARDFDDAVCVMKKGPNSILYVSIADVAEYVRPGSALDREAYSRGTSVYLPNECLPMLPEKLSNNLCSLNPFLPRLTLTAEIHFNAQHQWVETRYYQSVIRSRKRATYEEVQAYFDGVGDNDFDADLKKSLQHMKELAEALMKKTEERGAIGFDFPEAKIIYDAQGKITTVQKAQRFFSHKLIEEFMISANVAVAQYFSLYQIPLLYRVHDQPNEIKVGQFLWGISNLGLKNRAAKQPAEKFDPAIFFRLLKGDRLEYYLQSVFLRSLKQAIYDPNNLGHYGLALKDYAHFTSPIRRYPDLTVHRQLKFLLNQTQTGVITLKRSDLDRKNLKSPHKFFYSHEELSEIGAHTSKRERDAMETEREVVAIKKTCFIKDFVHEKFFGKIARITKYGIYVELDPYFVEGWLPLSKLVDDYYIYDEKRIRLVGRKTRKILNIEDRVWVTVADAKIETGEIILDAIPEKKRISGKKRRR